MYVLLNIYKVKQLSLINIVSASHDKQISEWINTCKLIEPLDLRQSTFAWDGLEKRQCCAKRKKCLLTQLLITDFHLYEWVLSQAIQIGCLRPYKISFYTQVWRLSQCIGKAQTKCTRTYSAPFCVSQPILRKEHILESTAPRMNNNCFCSRIKLQKCDLTGKLLANSICPAGQKQGKLTGVDSTPPVQ